MQVAKRWHTFGPDYVPPPPKATPFRVSYENRRPLYLLIQQELQRNDLPVIQRSYLQTLLSKFSNIVLLMQQQRYKFERAERVINRQFQELYPGASMEWLSIYEKEVRLWDWETIHYNVSRFIQYDQRGVVPWKSINDFIGDTLPPDSSQDLDCYGEVGAIWNHELRLINYPGSRGLTREAREYLNLMGDRADVVTGRGRDPVHNYGIIKDGAGRVMHACCGEKLNLSDGCWIAPDELAVQSGPNGRLRPVPYRVFETVDPWLTLVETEQVDANLRAQILGDLVVGTYYRDYYYFSKLDSEIKSLWAAAVDILVRGYEAYVIELDAAIDADPPEPRPRNPATLVIDDSRELVTLENLYRAIKTFNRIHCTTLPPFQSWLNNHLFKVPKAMAQWTEDNRSVIRDQRFRSGEKQSLLKPLKPDNYNQITGVTRMVSQLINTVGANPMMTNVNEAMKRQRADINKWWSTAESAATYRTALNNALDQSFVAKFKESNLPIEVLDPETQQLLRTVSTLKDETADGIGRLLMPIRLAYNKSVKNYVRSADIPEAQFNESVALFTNHNNTVSARAAAVNESQKLDVAYLDIVNKWLTRDLALVTGKPPSNLAEFVNKLTDRNLDAIADFVDVDIIRFRENATFVPQLRQAGVPLKSENAVRRLEAQKLQLDSAIDQFLIGADAATRKLDLVDNFVAKETNPDVISKLDKTKKPLSVDTINSLKALQTKIENDIKAFDTLRNSDDIKQIMVIAEILAVKSGSKSIIIDPSLTTIRKALDTTRDITAQFGELFRRRKNLEDWVDQYLVDYNVLDERSKIIGRSSGILADQKLQELRQQYVGGPRAELGKELEKRVEQANRLRIDFNEKKDEIERARVAELERQERARVAELERQERARVAELERTFQSVARQYEDAVDRVIAAEEKDDEVAYKQAQDRYTGALAALQRDDAWTKTPTFSFRITSLETKYRLAVKRYQQKHGLEIVVYSIPETVPESIEDIVSQYQDRLPLGEVFHVDNTKWWRVLNNDQRAVLESGIKWGKIYLDNNTKQDPLDRVRIAALGLMDVFDQDPEDLAEIFAKAPGLTNVGNTCFANSGIQMLYNVPELKQVTGWSDNLVAAAFKTLQGKMDGNTLVDRGALDTFFQAIPFITCGQQEDSSEFLVKLIDTFPLAAQQLFEYETVDTLFYEDPVTQPNKGIVLSVPVVDWTPSTKLVAQQSLNDAFKKYFERESVELASGENVEKQLGIRSTSDYFIINLARYYNEYELVIEKGVQQKRTQPPILFKDAIIIPQNLTLDSIGEFELISAVKHLGETTASGHYVAYVKANDTMKWYQCNDEIVSLMPDNALQSELDKSYILMYKRTVAFQPEDLGATSEQVTLYNETLVQTWDEQKANKTTLKQISVILGFDPENASFNVPPRFVGNQTQKQAYRNAWRQFLDLIPLLHGTPARVGIARSKSTGYDDNKISKALEEIRIPLLLLN